MCLCVCSLVILVVYLCFIYNRCQRVAPTAKVDHWSPKSRNRSQDAASP